LSFFGFTLPSREGKLRKSPLPLWERVRVRGKNLKNFEIFNDL